MHVLLAHDDFKVVNLNLLLLHMPGTTDPRLTTRSTNPVSRNCNILDTHPVSGRVPNISSSERGQAMSLYTDINYTEA